MEKRNLELFQKWFGDYVAGFYAPDDDYLNQNIKLKECHTHRVCGRMRELITALGLNEQDGLIAETIALFHDVGRFEQFKRYRTYKDTISENHCLLAVKVLGENGVLDRLAGGDRGVIETAIEFHGAIEIPPMDDRSRLFTQMIRDTDKIDIFELLVKNYKVLADDPENFKWELEFPDTPECNPTIIDAILNRRLIDYRELKTINDAKLLQLGWVYDIYFDYSLKAIYDHGYLQTIIDLLPETDEVKQATETILNYTQERIRNHD
ncbi:MAG: HD domain-containing protein [Planctomycetota bacterium]|jgi:hypothetical protein